MKIIRIIPIICTVFLLSGCFGKHASSGGGPDASLSISTVEAPLLQFVNTGHGSQRTVTVDITTVENSFLISPSDLTGALTLADTTPVSGNLEKLVIVNASQNVTSGSEVRFQLISSKHTSLGLHSLTLTLSDNSNHGSQKPLTLTANVVAGGISGAINSVAISSDGKYMIAGGQDSRIYTSNNEGQTWSNPKVGWYEESVAASSDGTYMLAANADNYIYRSTNHGESWEQVLHNDKQQSGWMRAVATSGDGQHMVAGTDVSADKIYVSQDYGDTWGATHTTQSAVRSVAISNNGQYVVAGDMDNNIYTSSDSGKNWNNKLTGGVVKSVAISNDGRYMIAGSADHKIYVSNNYGGAWDTNNKTTGGAVMSVAISADGQHMIAGSADHKIYVSNDHGVNFTSEITTNDNVLSVAVSDDGQHIIAGIAGDTNHNIYISNDGGQNWNNKVTGNDVNSVAISADGKHMVAGDADRNIYYSYDYGDTFYHWGGN